MDVSIFYARLRNILLLAFLLVISLVTGCSNINQAGGVINGHGGVYQDSRLERDQNVRLVSFVRDRTIETQQYEVNHLKGKVLRSSDELEKLGLTNEQRSLLNNEHQRLRDDLKSANRKLYRAKAGAE